MVDGFHRHHLAHIASARGVAHHGGAAAQKGDGTMTGLLHMHHDHDLNKMTDMEAVRRGVKADIERDLLFFKKFFDLIFVGALFDISSFG